MTEIKHNETCLKLQKAREEWLAKWPGHCKSCEGAGAWQSSGTYEEPPDGGPCHCVEDGFCPRCGKSLTPYKVNTCPNPEIYWLEDHWGCETCGWTDENPDICPDPDCQCWADPKLNPAYDDPHPGEFPW